MKIVFTSFVSCMLVYVGMAFLTTEFNPMNWDFEARLLSLLTVVAITAFKMVLEEA